jgi:PAS domain S-box-containing protein
MVKSKQDLLKENDDLRRRLKESEEVLGAIRKGDVDALVVSGPNGNQVYTIQGADYAYRVAIETVTEGAITVTSEGTILYCNRRFAEMVRRPMEKVVGASIYDFVPDDGRSALRTLLLDADKCEISLLTGDKLLPVYISASALNISELSNARSVIIMDLTDQKRSEEMVAAERLARSIIEQAAEAIVVCDAEGKIIRASRVASQILGRDPSLQNFDDLFVLRLMHGERIHPVHASLRGNIILKSECTYERSDGRTFYLLLNAGPLESAESRIIGCVITLSDITERKQIEEELRKSKDELDLRVQERTAELQEAKENLEVINEELQVEISEHEKTEKQLMAAKEAAETAVEAKAAFLANMSHELRTPLNAVIGYSSLLLDDNLTVEQKEGIESIKSGGEALLAIIAEILEFSRAEKEKIVLEHQPFSLKRCIEDSMDMVATEASQKGLSLNYTINYSAPDTIMSDPGRLRQILVNLLGNAVKFTDMGEVSLSASSKSLGGNKRVMTFEVRDTGIGMPHDNMDRIFEPFTQLEYVMSRKRDGAGLGLAISKKLVELMGGEIWAESEEGKGSKFRFTIQAETIPDERPDSGEKDRERSIRKLSVDKPLSILVAEDNPSNQKVLVEMLKRLGYRPDAVANGAEVIQALKIRSYDLVFMDIRMPEMDGLSAAKEIRKVWPNNGPTIVAITAFAMESDQKMCMEAGMDGYIAKPVKLGDLAEVISKYHPRENS